MKENFNCDLRLCPDDVKFCIDYLRGYTFTSDVAQFFKQLGDIDSRLAFENWCPWRSGSNFYATRWALNDEGTFQVCWNIEFDPDKWKNSTVLCHPSDNYKDFDFPEGYFTARDQSETNGGIYVCISGDGIRYLGNDTFTKILDLLYSHAFTCTRIDFACDIFNEENTIVPLLCQAFNNLIAGKYEKDQLCLKGSFRLDTVAAYAYPLARHMNYSVGRSNSAYMFRMYDKYNEITHGRLKKYAQDMLDGITYWTRLEYQCNVDKGNAQAYWLSLMKHKSKINELFAHCLNNFISPAYIDRVFEDRLSYSEVDELYQEFVNFVSTEQRFIQQIVYLKYVTRERFLRNVKRMSGWCYQVLNDPKAMEIVLQFGKLKFLEDKRKNPYRQELAASLST